MQCLFCNSDGPFGTVEHIIPESLGNTDLLLKGQMCDGCQNYFGREVEEYVLSKSPIGVWRVLLGIKTKKARNPAVDMSQPPRQKGRLPCVHPQHDNVGFAAHEDGSLSVDIDGPEIVRQILDGQKTRFQFVMTPQTLFMVGRFLCKVGVELFCLENVDFARSDRLQAARKYARFGQFDGLWPVFYFTHGNLNDLRRLRVENHELLEDVDCYRYSLLDFQDRYKLFCFGIGADNWVISLNDPFPHADIRQVFSETLELIWYPPEALARRGPHDKTSG